MLRRATLPRQIDTSYYSRGDAENFFRAARVNDYRASLCDCRASVTHTFAVKLNRWISKLFPSSLLSLVLGRRSEEKFYARD